MKSMSDPEFVAVARAVLAKFGGTVYEDDVVVIRSDYNGLDLHVTRKDMTHVAPHLSGTNPTTMVRKGEIIRHHPEATYLEDHVRNVLVGRVPRTAETIGEDELRDAVVSLIGSNVFDVLDESMGFVAAHERACKVAFVQGRSGPEVETVRAAMSYLDRHGRYPFYQRPATPGM